MASAAKQQAKRPGNAACGCNEHARGKPGNVQREAAPWVGLQQTVGNRATARVLAGLAARQREDEADRAADAITKTAEPVNVHSASVPPGSVQRKCSQCEEEDKGMLFERKARSASSPSSTEVELPSGGDPLPAAERTYLEGRFGRRFDSVRIHTGAGAYTSGPHIVFGPGEYAPGTERGRWLLAHELAHVAQQVPLPRLSTATSRQGLGIVDTLGPGHPLESQVRTRMERAFGASFLRVRLHTDASAARECSRAGEPALHFGDHILVRPDLYRPGTPVGDAVLAHQLAHLVERTPAPPSLAQSSRSENPSAWKAATRAIRNLWRGAKGFRTAELSPRLASSLRVAPSFCGGGGNESTPAPTAKAPSCDDVCRRARADSSMNTGGGGVICDGATKCACFLGVPSMDIRVGECPEIDRIAMVHETRHLADVDCDASKGLHRPPFRDPSNATKSECTHRKETISLLDTGISSASDPCLTRMKTLRGALDTWVKGNC